MTNVQIKKVIIEATKGHEHFTVAVKVWHDRTEQIVFLDVYVYEGLPRVDDYTSEIIEQAYVSYNLKDTPANIKVIKRQAQQNLKYLAKLFQHTTATEGQWL